MKHTKKVWKGTFVTKLYYNRRHEVRQIPDSPQNLLAVGNLMNTALFDRLKYEEDLHAPARGTTSLTDGKRFSKSGYYDVIPTYQRS